jgi:exodeoxyribonuclease VII small subunit
MKKMPEKFEIALRDLEGVVEKLETGDLSLEDALGAF